MEWTLLTLGVGMSDRVFAIRRLHSIRNMTFYCMPSVSMLRRTLDAGFVANPIQLVVGANFAIGVLYESYGIRRLSPTSFFLCHVQTFLNIGIIRLRDHCDVVISSP